jgi:hypothetical protein
MKKTFLALAFVAGLTSFAGTAKADLLYTFDYSFNGNGGAVTGTVLGTIDSGILTPTAVTAQSGGQSYSFLASDPNSNITGFGFNVKPEVVSSYSIFGADYFNSQTGATPQAGVAFNLVGINEFYLSSLIGRVLVYNEDGFNGVSYGAVTLYQDTAAVPEPSTFALFGLGAIGMLMVMRRKKTA